MEYKAIFLDEDLNEIGNKKFDSTDEFITFKKGTFNVRLNAFLFRNRNTTFYAYVYPTDEKLLIDVKIEPLKNKDDKNLYSGRLVKIKEKLEKGDLKLLVADGIIGQLARMAILGLKTNWVLILVVAVGVGLGAGGFSYTFGYNNGISQAYGIINATASLYPTPIPHIG